MCGITALFSKNKNIFSELYEGLYHLQHRGQDSFGFSYIDNKLKDNSIKIYKQKGLLSQYQNKYIIDTNIGLGHVRYPTKGSLSLEDAQPLYIKGKYHTISLVHNGQIDINYILSKIDINDNNDNNDNYSDSYYLLKYLSYLLDKYVILDDNNIISIIKELQNINGSFNCICIVENFGLICFKDKYSIRPLILGKKDESYIISSESISITSINYNIINDLYGNDVIVYSKNIFKTIKLSENPYEFFKPCIFEWIYLAREESTLYNVNVYQSRVNMGKHLANKIINTIDIDDIDIVVPVPDTSKSVALEVSKQLNKPYYEAITKNRYVNRTFIMDSQEKRKKNIKRKLNIINHLVSGKNILIIDDSIVRGNTIKHIVNLLKENNVSKIFIGISCPKIINTNMFGIDVPTKEELLCYNYTNEIIEKNMNIEKIIFQDLIDLKNSINPNYNFELSVFTK
jgi:amidophosphoribosyltransferase